MMQRYNQEGSYKIEDFNDSVLDFYDKDTLLLYAEDGLLSSEEEGFMIGYLAA